MQVAASANFVKMRAVKQESGRLGAGAMAHIVGFPDRVSHLRLLPPCSILVGIPDVVPGSGSVIVGFPEMARLLPPCVWAVVVHFESEICRVTETLPQRRGVGYRVRSVGTLDPR